MEEPEAEDENEVLMDAQDNERYRVGRDGDHLAGVPFECDLCHFRNMNRRDPVWQNSKDVRTLEAIRRVQLDVFWAREPGTVKGNLGRMRRDYLDVTGRYSVGDHLLPYFPTHTLEDRVGMSAAITMLTASLRAGIYGSNIQWATARKSRTWLRNLWNSADRSSSTDGKWFCRFCRRMKWRMGEVKFQNEALTPDMVVELGMLLNEVWELSTDEKERESVEELMSYILIGFGVGLRGEEVPLASLKGMLSF